MPDTDPNANQPQRTDDIVGVLDATTQVDILDYFAAAALAGGLPEYFRAGDTWQDYDDFAKSMFGVAQAMVAERERVREQALSHAQRRAAAESDLLAIAKLTAENLRHLHSSTSGEVYKEYSDWLALVEAAIAKVEGPF